MATIKRQIAFAESDHKRLEQEAATNNPPMTFPEYVRYKLGCVVSVTPGAQPLPLNVKYAKQIARHRHLREHGVGEVDNQTLYAMEQFLIEHGVYNKADDTYVCGVTQEQRQCARCGMVKDVDGACKCRPKGWCQKCMTFKTAAGLCACPAETKKKARR